MTAAYLRLSRRCLIAVLWVVILSAGVRVAGSDEQIAGTYIPRLEKILTQNIVPFWYDKSIDRVHGGYTISFDAQGRLREPVTKMIVTQARQVWLFSRLARAGYEPKKYLEAAEHGYRFLREKMWDPVHGGFHWEVDVTGNQKLRPNKHLYGQSFGLYAISEYYLASGRQEVLDFAIQFFNLLEEKSHDKVHGGYSESFRPDWTPAPAGENSYMGAPSGLKLMNTHLHLLEAMTTFYRASKLPLARERLLELINIESNTVVRKTIGACTDKYDPDWTVRLDSGYDRVSYGHDIENVWLLMDACDAAGVSNWPFLDLYKTLFEYSLKYGYDERQGGFFYSGRFHTVADDRSKSWWVQAEVIVSALYMYQYTKDPKYRAVFENTFRFIETRMVDWEVGEWHSTVTAQGEARGDKASPWKAGYHNGRAMIECLEMLRSRQN
ncbi:MAG: N-acylglucosamine 2-epimerase [Planctomycetes bacterium]|nr:N-acylglucosamine 2-epimerase [Planctomycetota bacterium]